MVVIRYTNIIKPGHMDELVAVLRASVEAVNWPHAVRAYVPIYGSINVLNVELEFESLEEYESFRATLTNVPELAAFYEKLEEVMEVGGSREVWNLVE
jgi:hypothetical protein